MKEIKGISYDVNSSSWINYDLAFKHSGKSLSDFLKMTDTKVEIKYKDYSRVKEPTEEDLFKNLSDNLKEVYQKIN
jgi:hypothetical protein